MRIVLVACFALEYAAQHALAHLPDQADPADSAVPARWPNGYRGYFDISVWYGILAPAGTPRDTINRLNAEINKAIAAPDMKEKLSQNGIEPLGGTPEQFGNYIRSESVRFGKVIKAADIRPE